MENAALANVTVNGKLAPYHNHSFGDRVPADLIFGEQFSNEFQW